MKTALPETAGGGPEAGGATLTFDWKRPGRLPFRLFFLVLFSLLAHAGCFYFFQVVNPVSERVIPAPARVTLLSSSDLRGREMLREIEDRVVYFDSSARESVRETPMETFAVAFRPSFANHQLEPRIASPVREEAPIPEPFEFERAVLPGVVKEETSGDVSAAAPSIPLNGVALRITPGESLRDRAILARGDWKWTKERGAELEGQRVVLTVGVTAQGRLQHVLVNTGIDSALDVQVVAGARGILFEPVEESELQWGTLRIQW